MTSHRSFLKAGCFAALLLTPTLAGCDTGPSDPFGAARKALAEGNPRTALDLVGLAIDADPNNPAIRMLAGDAAMAMGNPDRAIAEFERVPETYGEYSLARAKLAEAQVMANAMEAAGETLSDLTMDTALAYTATIAFHFARGEAEEGFAVLDEGLAKFPDDPRLVTVDAERLWAQGKAQQTFARLEPVLAVKPAVAQAHMFAGQLRLGSRDVEMAEEHFQKVLSAQPRNQTAMLALAAIARDKGDTGEAGNWINKANEAGRPHPIGLLFAAQMAFDAGDMSRAFELIEKAPPVFASEPEFTRLRGMIDAARDQHAMAALALGDYVEATGGDPMARRVLASSLAEEGEYAKAWAAIEPVIDHPQADKASLTLAIGLAQRTGKGNPEAIRARLTQAEQTAQMADEMLEAGAAIRAGDWAKADAIYAPLTEGKGKTNPALLNNAAAVKTKLEEHDAAVALARRALAAAPDSPEIMDTLGWALWQRGSGEGSDRAEAREWLQKARKAAPTNREIAEHWAIAFAE